MVYGEEYLEHTGVLGMKWGKRKARKNEAEIQRRVNKQLTVERKVIKKQQRRMSNKELQSRVKRLKLEEDFKKLNPKPESKIKIDKIVKSLGMVAAVSTTALTIYSNIDKISGISKAAKKAAKAAEEAAKAAGKL